MLCNCGQYTLQKDGVCSSCKHIKAKAEKVAANQAEKLAKKLLQQKARKQEPKAKISKNPKDWTNTFNCSDGTKVTQSQINNKLDKAYKWSSYTEQGFCLGCGQPAQGHAHIIAKARCKRINKTELIWNPKNYFEACHKCNSAIENPKGREWRYLLNIDSCLSFIKENDYQLFTKFEISAIDQTKQTV